MNLESYECVLCNQHAEESIEHLFIACPFAQQAWQSINLQVNADLQPIQNLELLKNQINQSFFYGSHHSPLLGNMDEQK